MKEKEILSQLNKYQSVKPDEAWKTSNRELLLSQISNSQGEVETTWVENFKLQFQVFRSISQPAMAVLLICAFILSGGAFGLKASQDTKPGDSLYIAKIISEKTQLAFTFDEKKKVRLGVEFAGNRAKELSQVLASVDNSEEDSNKKQTEVAKLMDDFKKEITEVKSRVEKIQPITEEEEIEEGVVFLANSGKDENGVQVSDPIKIEEEEVIKETDPKEMLKEVEELLEKEDYNGAITKLEEAGEAIVGEDKGEVKGESEEGKEGTEEVGTSTEVISE